MTSTILIAGNTRPIEAAIKALGGKWDRKVCGWRVPADKASQAQQLIATVNSRGIK